MNANTKAWLTEQFGADETLHAEIYAQYLHDVQTAVRGLVGVADCAELGKRGHAVKGMALAVGDADMAAAALALQRAGEQNDAAACATACRRLTALAATLDRE